MTVEISLSEIAACIPDLTIIKIIIIIHNNNTEIKKNEKKTKIKEKNNYI
jgi:hypothetical protein